MKQFIANLVANLVTAASVSKAAESRPLATGVRILVYPSGRIFLLSHTFPRNVECKGSDEIEAILVALNLEVIKPKEQSISATEFLASLKAEAPEAVTIDPKKKTRLIRVIKK